MINLKQKYIEEVQTGTETFYNLNLRFKSNCKPFFERVGIRYTTDNWKTYNDLDGQQIKPDTFLIKLKINKNSLTNDLLLKYAIYMSFDHSINNIQFHLWNNNNEKNFEISFKDITGTIKPGCVMS